MKNPRESITLRALDRLPPAEVHEAEAAIAEDPELARQLREIEDIAAHLWHASSPLHSAPTEIWEHIEREIRPSSESAPGATIRNMFLALGWAAALVLLLVLLFRGNPAASPTATTPPPPDRERAESPPHSHQNAPLPSKSPDQDRSLSVAERRLRTQLSDLRERLARLENDPATLHARPRIVPLHRPGSIPAADGGEASAHVLSLITSALATDLQRRQERATDLVIEKGWQPDLFLDAPSETVIRHRSFLDAAEDLQFLVAKDGRYFDPASKFVWSPAEDGGGYLGRRAREDLDLALFTAPEPLPYLDSEKPLIALNDGEPLGYLIEDPTTRESTLIAESLPPQPPGTELVGQFFNANGTSMEFNLAPSLPSSTTLHGSQGVTAVPLPREASISNHTSFNVVTRSPDGTTNVVLSNRAQP